MAENKWVTGVLSSATSVYSHVKLDGPSTTRPGFRSKYSTSNFCCGPPKLSAQWPARLAYRPAPTPGATTARTAWKRDRYHLCRQDVREASPHTDPYCSYHPTYRGPITPLIDGLSLAELQLVLPVKTPGWIGCAPEVWTSARKHGTSYVMFLFFRFARSAPETEVWTSARKHGTLIFQ